MRANPELATEKPLEPPIVRLEEQREAVAGRRIHRRVLLDAPYAVECAALGETSLAPLESYVPDLERRLAALEARLWPRARHALRQVLRRPG
jgi:hypothetical protein